MFVETNILHAPEQAVNLNQCRFHMLAHIGVIVKLWFSVLPNLKLHIRHPRLANDDAPSNL